MNVWVVEVGTTALATGDRRGTQWWGVHLGLGNAHHEPAGCGALDFVNLNRGFRHIISHVPRTSPILLPLPPHRGVVPRAKQVAVIQCCQITGGARFGSVQVCILQPS